MTFPNIDPLLAPPQSVAQISAVGSEFIFALDTNGGVWAVFVGPTGLTEWRFVGPPGAAPPP